MSEQVRQSGPGKALAEWFSEQGERQAISAKHPFLLDDPAAVWFVEQGRVEIFTVAVEDGEPAGPRQNFTSILPGELMFGMDLAAYGMGSGFLAVGKLGTVLHRVDLASLRRLADEPLLAEPLAAAINVWVRKLSNSLTRDVVPHPRVDVNMVADEPARLASHRKTRANSDVLWVGNDQGELLYIGMEALDLPGAGALFPLTQDSWLEAVQIEQEIELQGHHGARVIAEARYWAGLELFHETLCNCEFINKRLATVDEYNRLADKSEHSEQAREQAYQQIYSVMAQPGRRKQSVEILQGEHPFGAACRLVGAAMGIEVVVPSRLEEIENIEERIALVARASRFRTRPVALKGDWFRYDQGPIITLMEETKQPVALLPTSPTSYEYVVPATGERGKVDDALNQRLSVFGAVFYRPFPDGPMTAFGLLKFGARGLRGDIYMLLTMGVLLGALGALTPLFTGMVFDQAIPQAERGLLIQFALGLLIAAFVSVVFTITQRIATLRIQGKMDYSIQAAVWDRLLDLPSTFFAKYEAGDLADRAAGINAIRGLLAGAGVSAILGSLSSVFYVVLMFVYNFNLALIAMLLTGVFVGFTFAANYAQIRLQRQQLQLNGRIASLVLQLLSGVSKLRTSGAENHAFYTWSQDFSKVRRLSFKIGTIQNYVLTFNSAFPIIASMSIFAGLVFLSGDELGTPGMTTGQFIAFNAAFGAFLTASLALSDASLGLLRALPLYERLKPIITTPAEIDETKEPPGELSGEIELSHVHFRYDPEGPWIIKDVSLKIRPGEFVAFVGGSGCGKSTMMRLTVGFETPEKGSVYFDGKDLATLDLREVRQQMGVVLQDSQVLPVDIFRNIVGTSSLTEEDAWEAARKVGLENDIKQMPMGMHTYVMEGGGGFSGGQIQRLLLARAVVNNPRIILLDEATSALDNKTQAIVTQSMNRMQATRIAIAHRLSTIVDADTIYVLDKGEIAESGSYEELMALDGLFAKLAKRQIA